MAPTDHKYAVPTGAGGRELPQNMGGMAFAPLVQGQAREQKRGQKPASYLGGHSHPLVWALTDWMARGRAEGVERHSMASV